MSAKTGNAVERNLFKRRLRQFSVERNVEIGFDAVIFPTVKLKKTSWSSIEKDMEDMVGRAEVKLT